MLTKGENSRPNRTFLTHSYHKQYLTLGAHAQRGLHYSRSVLLSVTLHLTSLVFFRLTNDTTYLTGNEGQNVCAVFSENAPLQSQSTPSIVWLMRSRPFFIAEENAHAVIMLYSSDRISTPACYLVLQLARETLHELLAQPINRYRACAVRIAKFGPDRQQDSRVYHSILQLLMDSWFVSFSTLVPAKNA